MMKANINLKRRKFIQNLSLLAAGSSLQIHQNRLGLFNNALAASGDYSGITDQKSLVCIYLSGGNDAFNMFVPYENTRYQQYAAIRGALAIPRNQLLPVTGDQHSFHPGMAKVRDLYNNQKIALINNVGNLIEPLTREQFLAFASGENVGVNVPPDLFSHSHQTEIAQTNLAPQSGTSRPGWGGLIADLLNPANSNSGLSPSFSLSGNNLWQSGNLTQPFSLNSNSVKQFTFGYTAPSSRSTSLTNSWLETLNLNYQNRLQQQIGKITTLTEQRVNALAGAVTLSDGIIQTPFNNKNNLAAQLRMIARLIYARDAVGGLGMQRQVFFAKLDAFDTHDNQLTPHANLLSMLDEALHSFYQTTVELGVADSVTTFTLSEFGRSMARNRGGTDHGWGSYSLVMGDAVDGGKIHGELPDLTPGGNDDSGSAGRIIPKISIDQYGATLAKWMGISDSDLLNVFPNLGNFTVKDLGFMQS